jgi:citrate lyase beta subunit
MLFPKFRSILMIPAIKVELYSKGSDSEADLLIIDFEDSISLNEKEKAREAFLTNKQQIAQSNGYSFRINSLNSTLGLEDLLFLINNKIDVEYLMLPKIHDSFELFLIRSIFCTSGLNQPKLIASIEDAEGATNLDAIAKFSDALVFGAADFALDLGLMTHVNNFLHIRQMIVLHASKYRIPAIDSPTFAVRDLNKLSDDCIQSKMIGFSGKAAISKGQVDTINQAYQHTPDELNWAQNVLGIVHKTSTISTINQQMVGTPFYNLAKLMITNEKENKNAN